MMRPGSRRLRACFAGQHSGSRAPLHHPRDKEAGSGTRSGAGAARWGEWDAESGLRLGLCADGGGTLPYQVFRTLFCGFHHEKCQDQLPNMSTAVFEKLSNPVIFEDNAKEVERSSLNYIEVINGQHPDILSSSSEIKDSSAVRHRRAGPRQSGMKVRHKRQTLQDMARPLKQWLYTHRDNPYPTKTEKILLALGSQMTLVQVSNWFANARRRLKNTVRQPNLSWALRIKLYNKYVQGNAERLSVSSDGSCSEDGETPLLTQSSGTEFSQPRYQSVIKKEGAAVGPSLSEDYVSPPKYKSSLLHRYLNDSLCHVMASNRVVDSRKRNHSGSFSSNEYDEEILSPSSSETEGNFVYRNEAHDALFDRSGPREKGRGKDETYWKEMNAAMALTNLAQVKDSASETTSCIIQKSSHISEIKTVKMSVMHKY
ncbi:homeobox protein Mohawk-like [Arapaima gigas]